MSMNLTFTIPRKRTFNNVYQFKITLLETKPSVWRRILVPQSYTYYDLHVAIQNAMGWTDSHLHCFDSKKRYDPSSINIDCPFGEPLEEEDNVLYTTETALTYFFKEAGNKMFYTYDFGDNWHHEVVLEKIFAKDQKKKYPVCLAGELACPPEDCGSIPGYYNCIKTFEDKKDEELLEWMGDWNPESFDPKDVIFDNPRKRFMESWG